MCYHPWVGLDVSPQGELKPCCKYQSTIARNIDDYKSSGTLATIREQLLSGERPAGCSRCWIDEDSGLKSKRQLDNEYVFKNIAPDLSSIKVLSLPFGNTCNLACRICNSYSSSKWSTEAKKIQHHFPDIPLISPAKFQHNPVFIQAIKDLTHNLIHVDIPGGEPFYADLEIHTDFLDHLSSHGPENITLHYTTNGTIFPDVSILDRWSKFKTVDIQLSIDGTENKFEYNRWPGKWKDTLGSIRLWKELADQRTNIKISISHTVSVFTIFDLPEFIQWCEDNGLEKPYLGLLTKPLHYSITILPEECKKYIEHKFYSYGNKELLPVINAMRAQDNSNQLDNFIKYVKILDRQRNQTFDSVFPELYQLLGEQCQILYQQY